MTADGKRAISASDDHTLKVWDLESGRALRTLEGHSSVVSCVAVMADGKRAVSASGDNTVRVWDVESGAWIASLHCDGAVQCCACIPQIIVAGDAAGWVHFLRLEENET